jgi:hypothetical protein
LDLSTRASLAPKIQLGSKSLGAFTDALESPMSGDSPLLQHVCFDALSIVANAKA